MGQVATGEVCVCVGGLSPLMGKLSPSMAKDPLKGTQ